jgi:ABC-type molybdate transport system permease subunit
VLPPTVVPSEGILVLIESPQEMKLGRSWLRSAQIWFSFRLVVIAAA